MRKETAELIVRHINENGTDAKVYHDYSGRDMYGEKTSGVVTGHLSYVLKAIAQAALYLREIEDTCERFGVPLTLKMEDFLKDLSSIRSDSMGRYDTIYF